jgi:hypothetical protein
VDFTLYLPDEIGQRAKDAFQRGDLSRLFRDAVTDELERRTAVSTTLDQPQTYELSLEDEDGRYYTGRITGKEIAYDERSGHSVIKVYLTEDERVIVHDDANLRYYDLSDDPGTNVAEELRQWLSPGAYSDAMHALGEKPVIDL